MAEQTGISWCDATFNPWWGCERVSPGCAHCYAAELAKRYGHAGTWAEKGEGHAFRFFGDPHWLEPRKWARTLPTKLGRRPRVFCASMADVFEPADELEEHRLRLLDLIVATPELDWLLLTKRPEVAGEWLAWRYDVLELDDPLPNVWLGTSVENQRFTWRADALRDAPAAVRFISAEPLLGSLLAERSSSVAERLGPDGSTTRSARSLKIAAPDSGLGRAAATPSHAALEGVSGSAARNPLDLTGIDWLIVGGESGGKTARPMSAAWVRELRDAAVELGIAFHFKQWGSWAPRGFVSGKLDVDRRPEVEVDGWKTFYYGPGPKAGGKLLDGVEYCEFPERERRLALA